MARDKRHGRYPDPDDPRKPDTPSDLSARTWKDTLRRTVTEFKDDDCTDWAAALTYYSVLSIFPAAIVLVSIVGLFGGPGTVDTMLKVVRDLGPESAVQTFEGPLRQVVEQRSAAGTLLGVGLVGALWSASGYVAAFSRVANTIYEVEEGRPFWKLRPVQILVTIVTVLLAAAVALSLVVSGPLAESVGSALGLGDLTVTIWQVAKWPVMAVVVSLIFSILYYAAPNVRQPRFRWFTLGGLVALVVWAAASAAFAFYVSNFGSYNKTYGTLGAVIVFMVWLWISNIAVLFGAELDAETERGRELQAGMSDAEHTIQLPPRQAAEKPT